MRNEYISGTQKIKTKCKKKWHILENIKINEIYCKSCLGKGGGRAW